MHYRILRFTLNEIEAPSKSTWRSFLTRDGKLILLQVLLNSIPLGYMNVIPAVYLLELKYSASVVGAIYAASALSNTIGLTPFGFLADRYGRKIFFLFGSFVPTISYVMFALTTNEYWLIVASVIGGVGIAGGIAVAMSGPALLPLLAKASSDKNRTTLFGATQAVWAIALTIGSLLTYVPGFFIRYLNEGSFTAHAVSYYFMAGLAAASAVPVLFIKEEGGRQRESKEAKQISEEAAVRASSISQRRSVVSWILDLPKSKRKIPLASKAITAKFSLAYALSGLGLGVIVQLIASWYYLQFAIPEQTAGLWVGIAEAASIPTIFMIPWLVKRRGTLYIAVVFLALSGLFLGFMPLSSIFILAAIFYTARNIFVNISWPVMQSYMMGIVAEKERATITGIATTAWGLANAVGTLVGGDLLASNLLYLPFVIGVAAYLASAVTLGFFFRGLKPPEEK
jgi:MFS family permease